MFFNHRKGKGLPSGRCRQQGRLTPSVRDPMHYSTAKSKKQEGFGKKFAVCSVQCAVTRENAV